MTTPNPGYGRLGEVGSEDNRPNVRPIGRGEVDSTPEPRVSFGTLPNQDVCITHASRMLMLLLDEHHDLFSAYLSEAMTGVRVEIRQRRRRNTGDSTGGEAA